MTTLVTGAAGFIGGSIATGLVRAHDERSLTGVVLMVDSRLGFTDLDRRLLEFVAPRVGNGSVKLLVLLTKADKLNREEQNKALSIARLQTGGGEVRLFSALKKQGVEEASLLLWQWTHPDTEAP